MIVIKSLLFFFGLILSLVMIEDFIEKVIAHLKEGKDEYHMLYTTGLIHTLPFWPTLLSVLFWSGLYLLNQL